jgi:hypothetical protein
MKFTEKLLRRPLPDQLKALLEKFDGDFDASHLRALKSLAFEESFTLYERFVLQRAHKMAQVKLERAHALDTAMTVVLNLKEEREDPHSGWYSNPAQQITNPYPAMPASLYQQQSATTTNLYQQHIDQKIEMVKRDLQRSLGVPR